MTKHEHQLVPHHVAKEEAKYSPTLERMLKNNIPLTRERYMGLSGADEHPEDGWTAEQEEQVPTCFQHPTDPQFYLRKPDKKK